MKIKRLAACLMAAMMCVGMFSTTAFAFVDETATEAAVEETTETPVEEVEQEEPMEPLTPDGNLTLVDDAGTDTKAGKQFVTLVTKNGNYFYLIIDRDDKGEQTVHFLNQVDESDLLSLMDDEEAQKYTPIVEETEKEDSETESEITPESEQLETEQKAEKKVNLIPALILVLALLAGGGFFVFTKLKAKKKSEQTKPDPDADYIDDEDYGYEEETENETDEYEDTDFTADEDDHEPV